MSDMERYRPIDLRGKLTNAHPEEAFKNPFSEHGKALLEQEQRRIAREAFGASDEMQGLRNIAGTQRALNEHLAQTIEFKNSPGYDPNIKLRWRSRLRLRRLYARHRVERWRERLADRIAP